MESNYSSAKVTIDLAEYNELLQKAAPKEGDIEQLYKTVIAEMMNYRLEPEMFIAALKRKGIAVLVRQQMGLSQYSADHIHVEKIKQ